jgi:hypothetical protein
MRQATSVGSIAAAAVLCALLTFGLQGAQLAGSDSQAPSAPGIAAQTPGQGQKPPGARGPGRPRTKKVVIAWADTRNGIAQHDSTSHALAVIERLGYESGLYDTFIRTDSNIISYKPLMTTGKPASGGPSLAMADAIFYMGHRDVPLPDEQKDELVKFIKDDGKGFVAAHVALTSFETWPEFGNILGARYGGHPWGNVTAPVINEDPAFPATRHFPATFTYTDEFYLPKDYSRDNIRVLLRLDVSKLPANANYTRTDGDFPIAWAMTYGKGRVFYSSFGHDAKTWDDPDVYRMYYEAVKWSLRLTDADVTPRPLPTDVK